MIIAISGSGGFIGKQLTAYFQAKGYEVRRISRIAADTSASEIVRQLIGVDVIINLAGAPIIGRWTKSYKKILWDSRIISTGKIVEAIDHTYRLSDGTFNRCAFAQPACNSGNRAGILFQKV